MNINYKLDIFDKVIQFIGLIYFVFGLLFVYSWSCKGLDFQTDNYDVLVFWEPVAGVYGLLMLTNVIIIVFYIWKERKNLSVRVNSETTILFYFLWILAFLITVINSILQIYVDAYNIETRGRLTLFATLSELCLFCASVALIACINHRMSSGRSLFQQMMERNVIFLTTIGLVNSLLYNFSYIMIDTFIEYASNSTVYSEFYNRSSRIVNETYSQLHQSRSYFQSTVILFCTMSIVHLLIGSSYSSKTDKNSTQLNQTGGGSCESLEISTRTRSSSLRISSLSFIFAVLFCTITLMFLLIINSLMQIKKYFLTAHEIFTSFPITIYVLLIVLLVIQICEMERWPKLVGDDRMIDKTLMWIGVAGQIIVSLGEIKFYHYYDTSVSMKTIVRVEYTLLIIQMLFQTVAVSLALDRQWLSPQLKSWQARFCPPVIMFSVNIAFFLFSVFVVRFDYLQAKGSFFISNLFQKSFISIGETLAILQRVHASLIFGKMIIIMYF